MKHILLCTDCSQNARQATDECLFLFKDQPIHYTILFSYAVDATNINNLVASNDDLKARAKNCLQTELKRIKSLDYVNPSISISPHIAYGKTENVVQRFIAKTPIDLVVFGHQGVNYSSNQLFGSTSEKLLYGIERPKLIVPQNIEKANTTETVVIVQESEIENIEWWSSITAVSKANFKLIRLPNENGKASHLSIPSFIEKQLSAMLDFTDFNSTEIKAQLDKTFQDQTPSFIHLNIRDRELATQVLSQQAPQKSIYNKAPFLIQPFH